MVDNETCIKIAKTIDNFDVMLETFNKKPEGFVCVICMYESDNDNDQEMEKILDKKLKHLQNSYDSSKSSLCKVQNKSRYCKIKTSHSYLCNHSYHTACVHEWFSKSNTIKCPLCQQELELTDGCVIESIFVEEPKLIITTYDFQYGDKKPCEEYYTLYGKKQGSYKCYSIMGYLFKECTYKNDLKHGIETEYFPNSGIKSVYTYVNGKKNGKFFVKSEEGWFIIKGEYENNKFKGRIRRWDEKDRVLIFSCQYIRGKKHGPEIIWHKLLLDNPSKKYNYNKLKSYTMYNNGVLNGFELIYSREGVLVKKAHYLNGILHGSYIENYDCGSKKCKSIYSIGKIIGISKKWYLPTIVSSFKTQQLSHWDQYNLNESNEWVKDGLCMEWHRNGIIKRYMPYIFGKLDGRAIHQNENGKLIEIGEYKAGKPHGHYYMYYNNLSILNDETQKLHWVMQFNAGLLHGKCIEYNTRGIAKLELEYENGVLKTMLT